MEKILDIITEKMQAAFEQAGYDRSFGRVTVSNGRTCANTSATALWPLPSSISAPPSRLPRPWQSSWTLGTTAWWRPLCRASST